MVRAIAALVTQKVADAPQPVQAEAREVVATYQSAAWRYIFFAGLSGSASAVLVVLAMKMVGIV